MEQILYYTCLSIVIIASLYVIFRKGKRGKVEEYQTPYDRVFQKVKSDFNNRRNK
jgi:hypothetical protein